MRCIQEILLKQFKMLNKAFAKIDNSALIVFRIFFGIVFFAEAVGALLLNWVDKTFIDPLTNFTFIGFEWLLPLQNHTMYGVFITLAIASLGVIVGYKYRISMLLIVLLWGVSYLGQKTSYNNHYYLMWLISILLLFLPANSYFSLDAKLNPSIKQNFMPQWIQWLFILQVSCVYFYATLAKFYPDWLNGTVTAGMFNSMTSFPENVRQVFSNKSFHLFIAYMGIAFDGLIVPALLWKRTRWFAIVASLFFHIFNSITLEIGVFPYFALSFCVFFFPPNQIRDFFFKRKTKEDFTGTTLQHIAIFKYFFIPYVLMQILLPLRHYFIKGDVLWTEEGHRLSWRMMLRSRSGEAQFRVVDKITNDVILFNNGELLTAKQIQRLNTPDVIWQMAQKIKQHFNLQNRDVAVYVVESNVRVNAQPYARLIDPTVDLAQVKWNHFKHHDWILEQNADQAYYYDNHTNKIPVQIKLQK